MQTQEYLPFSSRIIRVKRHTDIEYTFTMSYEGQVKPGQFFEVSIPKFGEAPISVSGIREGSVDLTIRRVGKVTDQVFERYEGDSLFMRGPYGNGFQVEDYRDSELVVIAGGTGVSPVRGVVDHFSDHPKERRSMCLVAGFKSPEDILFRDDFERWKKHMDVILTVDGADPDYEGPVGLVTRYIPDIPLEDPSSAKGIVVGPPAMMRFSVKGLLERGLTEAHIWVSYERKMCCGIGKCGHCRIGDRYVCVDGPVFPYTQAKDMMD